MRPGLAFLSGLALGAAAAVAVVALLDRARSRRLGRFFSHAAHEINTPITALNMTVLNFVSGVFGDLPPDQLKWMEMMREQMGRLNGMVGELRDLIHLVLTRDLALHTESVAPSELVEEALGMVRRAPANSPADLETSMPERLPPVRVDRGRSVRTLASMVFHARKFRTGGPLRVSVQSQDAFVDVCLEYAGQPIAEDEVRRSLELLYPAAQGGHTLNAVGLGLGVLRQIAHGQGGDLALRVDAQGRTALTLSLPVASSAPGPKC